MTLDWSVFTPGPAAAGGLLIGAAAVLLMLGAGRIAGISGIVGWLPAPGGGWRLAFLLGLCASPGSINCCGLAARHDRGRAAALVVAGLLVGLGTRMPRAAPAATASAGCRAVRVARWRPPRYSWGRASPSST